MWLAILDWVVWASLVFTGNHKEVIDTTEAREMESELTTVMPAEVYNLREGGSILELNLSTGLWHSNGKSTLLL